MTRPTMEITKYRHKGLKVDPAQFALTEEDGKPSYGTEKWITFNITSYLAEEEADHFFRRIWENEFNRAVSEGYRHVIWLERPTLEFSGKSVNLRDGELLEVKTYGVFKYK